MFANGDIYPCELLIDRKLGNVREADYDFKKIWFGEEADEARKFIRETKCFCTYECFLTINILFNPRMMPTVLKEWSSLKVRKAWRRLTGQAAGARHARHLRHRRQPPRRPPTRRTPIPGGSPCTEASASPSSSRATTRKRASAPSSSRCRRSSTRWWWSTTPRPTAPPRSRRELGRARRLRDPQGLRPRLQDRLRGGAGRHHRHHGRRRDVSAGLDPAAAARDAGGEGRLHHGAPLVLEAATSRRARSASSATPSSRARR